MIRFLFCLAIVLIIKLGTFDLYASLEDEPMHWSGDHTEWDRRNDTVKLVGNASLYQENESLTADRIELDLNTRTLDAYGNCVYVTNDPSTVIHGDEIHFNLDTKTGTVVGGQVSMGGILIHGSRINRLGAGRFQARNGEYTSCRDCPGTWSVEAANIDMELEGYAYLSDVTVKIKETPVAWLPYLIFPLKTVRQTGFLFPKFGYGELYGLSLFQPFFWAVSENADMTLTPGLYSNRGPRFEWEGRWFPSHDSKVYSQFFLQRDKGPSFVPPGSDDTNPSYDPTLNRWAFEIEQKSELFWDIRQYLEYRQVKDNFYPTDFGADIGYGNQETLPSQFSLIRGKEGLATGLSFHRDRNLLNQDRPFNFDPNTVQLFPRFHVSRSARKFPLGIPLYYGSEFEIHNFTRSAGPFDYDICRSDGTCNLGSEFVPGVDPIREATRLSLTPYLQTSARLFDVLAVNPSIQYRSKYYSFHQALPSTSRGYLLFQTDLSMQFEKIIETDDPVVPKYKHTVRPSLTYSRIPYINEPDHPFVDQFNIKTDSHRDHYIFDTNDLVPLSQTPSLESYFVPLGHSLEYSLLTSIYQKRRLIPKRELYYTNGRRTETPFPFSDEEFESMGVSYDRIFEFKASQALDILQFKESPDKSVPLTRLSTETIYNLDPLQFTLYYNYYPDLPKLLPMTDPELRVPHQVTTEFLYRHETGVRQSIFEFDRSVRFRYQFRKLGGHTSVASLDLNYSINDYLLPRLHVAYDFVIEEFTYRAIDFTFFSPAHCWKGNVITGWRHRTEKSGSPIQDWFIEFDFSLNLTGKGFGGVTEVYERSQAETF